MEIKNFSIKYGENVVFKNFDFKLLDGKITCLLGSSGCGKTTLLKAFSGLIPADIEESEKSSVIFQEPRLLPHLTARDNLALVLPIDKASARVKASDLLKKMELGDYENLYPNELSGGMAQRVAIARALIVDAPLLLMDEPFKGLDLALQDRLIKYFVKEWEKSKRTTLFITHSILEAILIADRICVLKKTNDGAQIVYDQTFDFPREKRALGELEVDKIRTELHKVLISL